VFIFHPNSVELRELFWVLRLELKWPKIEDRQIGIDELLKNCN
jgi:hypothetical protein